MKHSLGRKLFAPHRLCEYAVHRVELPLQRGKVQRPLCSRSLSSGCKVPQTGGLSTHLSLRLLQAGKSETTVPTASAPGEGALPGLQTLPSHWVLIQWGESSSLSSPFISPPCGPHTHDLIQIQLPPKDPISKLGDFNI